MKQDKALVLKRVLCSLIYYVKMFKMAIVNKIRKLLKIAGEGTFLGKILISRIYQK